MGPLKKPKHIIQPLQDSQTPLQLWGNPIQLILAPLLLPIAVNFQMKLPQHINQLLLSTKGQKRLLQVKGLLPANNLLPPPKIVQASALLYYLLFLSNITSTTLASITSDSVYSSTRPFTSDTLTSSSSAASISSIAG